MHRGLGDRHSSRCCGDAEDDVHGAAPSTIVDWLARILWTGGRGGRRPARLHAAGERQHAQRASRKEGRLIASISGPWAALRTGGDWWDEVGWDGASGAGWRSGDRGVPTCDVRFNDRNWVRIPGGNDGKLSRHALSLRAFQLSSPLSLLFLITRTASTREPLISDLRQRRNSTVSFIWTPWCLQKAAHPSDRRWWYCRLDVDASYMTGHSFPAESRRVKGDRNAGRWCLVCALLDFGRSRAMVSTMNPSPFRRGMSSLAAAVPESSYKPRHSAMAWVTCMARITVALVMMKINTGA